MDGNLTTLERQATATAKRYGRIAAVVVGAVTVGGVAFLIYRRTRRPTLRARLDDLSIHNLRALAAEVTGRLKDRLPSVTVKVNDKTEQERGTMESILRKVGPALVGAAGSALLQRIAGPPADKFAQPQAE